MTVERPSFESLAALSESAGFDLPEDDLNELVELAGDALGSFDRVAELAAAMPAARHDRDAGRPPLPEEDRWGAWARILDIQGAPVGRLRGKTVAIKDSIAVAGVPMRNGTRLLDGFVADRDATVVTRVLAAGATVTGKAECEALCLSGGSHTSDGGPVVNPHDPTRTSGGSSSGCAALVAAGEVDIAIGTDQGGSVRGPASWCGVVGMKPTYGLVPYTGVFPVEMTIDHVGPLARTVDDVALAMSALAGPDSLDPRQGEVPCDRAALGPEPDGSSLTYGLLEDGFEWPGLSDDRVGAVVRSAARGLEAAVESVREVSVPWHRNGDDIWNVIAAEGVWRLVLAGGAVGTNWRGDYWTELLEAFGESVRRRPAALPPTAKFLALVGRHTEARAGATHYARAQNLGRELASRYDEALADVDVLVLPTVPMLAPPLPNPRASLTTKLTCALNMGVNTCPFNVTGHPAITVPCGAVDGLPVGAMVVGRRWEDATVLAAGRMLESVVAGAGGDGAIPRGR